MRQQKKFTIQHPTDSEHQTDRMVGVEFKPAQWEMFKAVKSLSTLVPDCEPAHLLLALSQSRTEEEYTHDAIRIIPLILHQFEYQQDLSFPIRACLWVLACYWYHYGAGPKPGSLKKVKVVKHTEHENWLASLHCPVCKEQYHPAKKYTTKLSILADFSRWMANHAKHCTALTPVMTKKGALSKVREEEREQALQDRKKGEWYLKLKEMGQAGAEMIQYLMSLRGEVDRMEALLKEKQQSAEDGAYFTAKYGDYLEALKNRKLAEDPLGLSFEEKLVLGGYYVEQERLTLSLLGQMKVTEKREVRRQLKELKSKIAPLEKKMHSRLDVEDRGPVKLPDLKAGEAARKAIVDNMVDRTAAEKAKPVYPDLERLQRYEKIFTGGLRTNKDPEQYKRLEQARYDIQRKITRLLNPTVVDDD